MPIVRARPRAAISIRQTTPAGAAFDVAWRRPVHALAAAAWLATGIAAGAGVPTNAWAAPQTVPVQAEAVPQLPLEPHAGGEDPNAAPDSPLQPDAPGVGPPSIEGPPDQRRPDGAVAAAPQARPERSLDDLYAALAVAKTDPEARALVAEIESRLGSSGSVTVDILLKQSQTVAAKGDTGVALDLLETVTRLAPNFAEGWNQRALAAYQAEDYDEALGDLRRALALEPRHFGAIAGLAAILAQLDRKREAIAVYDRLIALNPRDEDARKARDDLIDEIGREV